MLPEICRQILAGGPVPPKIIPAPPPDLARVTLPYDEYTTKDIAHRLVYVEASRGCPFECEFCLSSLDVPVRTYPLEPFLAAMDALHERGVRHFKFVDRTFNLNVATSRRILEFFLARLTPGLFLHFGMIPDRLPADLRELIIRFPPGALQFEVGVQTFDPAVAAAIHRRQDVAQLENNFRFLREQTGVHVHADLIAGLPGESLEGFAAGFDRLVALRPQEIQVGLLNRLRGTPIVRHDEEWGMVYSPIPPYEIVQNRLIDFATMQRLDRFARYWDLVGNSGRFVETAALFWTGGASPFAEFLRFSDWLYTRENRRSGIALPHLLEQVFIFLTQERGLPPIAVAECLCRVARRSGQTELPAAVKQQLPAAMTRFSKAAPAAANSTTRRQNRHHFLRRVTRQCLRRRGTRQCLRRQGTRQHLRRHGTHRRLHHIGCGLQAVFGSGLQHQFSRLGGQFSRIDGAQRAKKRIGSGGITGKQFRRHHQRDSHHQTQHF